MKPNRRETLSLLAGAAPAALGMFSTVATTSVARAQDTKPNILFMLADNVGYGVPSSYTTARIKDLVGFLLGYPQFQEQ